jgi:hypothetical protein
MPFDLCFILSLISFFPGLYHIIPRAISFVIHSPQLCFITLRIYFIFFPGLFHLYFILPSLVSLLSSFISFSSQAYFICISFFPVCFIINNLKIYFILFPGLFHLYFIQLSLISLLSKFIPFSYQIYFICISFFSAYIIS